MPGTSDTFTSSNRLDKQPTGGNYNAWGAYLNTNFDLIDAAKDGNTIITLGTGTTQYTLSALNAATDEARMASLTFIGAPGGTATITAPNVPKLTWVENLVSGGYPLLWTNGTGTNAAVLNGAAAKVQCDYAGNMKILGGSEFGGRTLQKIGLGTATDDAVRMDQVSAVSGGLPAGGTVGNILIATGTNTATTTASWAPPGLQTIFIPAGAMTALTTNGATSTSIMCATSSRMVTALAFGTASAQYASYSIDAMPKSWDGKNIDIAFRGFTTGTSTNKFEMNFGMAQLYQGLTVDRAFNTSTNVCLGTEQGTASFALVTGSATGSVSGGTASNQAGLGFLISRNTTSTNQVMTGNFFLTGATLRYNTTYPNDA